jgi:hypothetical protein
MAASSLYEKASIFFVPSGYKSGKLYPQKPTDGSSDFDVTRATIAYRTNASGILESVASGVPRLDYPAAGGCPSLLVEPAATNLALRSEGFDNAYWEKEPSVQVVTSGSVLNKRGVTSQKLEFISGGLRRLFRGFSYVSGTTYTLSIFAKSDGVANLRLRLQDNANAAFTAGTNIEFNLINGTVTADAGYVASIIPQGDGWFRCIVTATCTASVLQNVGVWLINTTTAGEGIYIDAIQLETGSVATSYIPTVAATATRNADVISKTGVSGFIGQAEGTLYAEVDVRNFQVNGRILAISDGTSTNRVTIFFTTSNSFRFIVTNGGSAQVAVNSSTFSSGVFKVAVAYKTNDFVLYINGAQAATDTSGSVPACSDVYLGTAEDGGTNPLNDRIRAAAIYPTRLSNAELSALTTL